MNLIPQILKGYPKKHCKIHDTAIFKHTYEVLSWILFIKRSGANAK